jgi:ABC-2 type transport system permease protein
MLTDAIAAEGYKLLRNRNVLFWGFCASPLANLLFNLATQTYLFLRGSGAALRLSQAAGARVDLGIQVLQGMSSSTAFFFEIFTVAGAAALFAGEYRWETWRLLVPRNSRANLVLAKFAIFAMAASASILTFGFFAALSTLYGALLNGFSSIGFTLAISQTAGVFLGSLAELMVLGTLTALIAIASRAQMAATLSGICFVIAQAIGMGIARPWEAPVQDFAYLPVMSAYLIRAWAAGRQVAPGIFADPAKIVPASLFLLLWIGLLAALSVSLFRRQDLSRE